MLDIDIDSSKISTAASQFHLHRIIIHKYSCYEHNGLGNQLHLGDESYSCHLIDDPSL